METKNQPPFASKFLKFTKMDYATNDEVREVIRDLERLKRNFEEVLKRKP